MVIDSIPDFTPYLRKGDTVIWGQATAEPLTLTRALVAQRAQFTRLNLFLGIDMSGTLRPEHADHFRFMSYCGAGGNRALARAGLLDIFPTPYSQLLAEMTHAGHRMDVVFVQVAEVDDEGRYSLGLANDLLIAALKQARVIIAEVNPGVPRTFGERRLRADEIDLLVPAAFAPLQAHYSEPSPHEERIAEYVASLIEDGATLQVGVGGAAEATLKRLTDRKDLGFHSGIVGDALVDLAESGALTNARKTRNAGKSIAGVLMGTQRLYAFADRNPDIVLRGTNETHGAEALSAIDRFVAINSAIEVDLTGQANAEVANGDYLGAVGGAPDFLRAAHLSRGGVPIIALRSTVGKRSRIVASLSGPTSSARCDAGVIVTEHGIADLRGCSLAERARRMIAIAAPEHREQLEREGYGRG